jgi:hypothetical protein
VVQNYDLVEWKRDGGARYLAKGLYTAPANVGTASMPNYASLRTQATYARNGVTTFAGQADDPFALDLRVFNLLYGGDLSEVGNDTLKGYNVQSIAIQVPISKLGGKKNVIGVWSSTKKATSKGPVQSRLGMPLVNEVVIPLKDKDKFNASSPRAQFLKYVVKPELPVLNAVYGAAVPKEPRNDLVQVF